MQCRTRWPRSATAGDRIGVRASRVPVRPGRDRGVEQAIARDQPGHRGRCDVAARRWSPPGAARRRAGHQGRPMGQTGRVRMRQSCQTIHANGAGPPDALAGSDGPLFKPLREHDPAGLPARSQPMRPLGLRDWRVAVTGDRRRSRRGDPSGPAAFVAGFTSLDITFGTASKDAGPMCPSWAPPPGSRSRPARGSRRAGARDAGSPRDRADHRRRLASAA